MGKYFVIVSLLIWLTVTGCASPKGGTTQERRDFVLYMRDDAMNDLYSRKPALKAEVAESAGYAVFTNVGMTMILVGGGQGYGVVTDNKTGEEVCMKMAQGSIGLGLGVNDFRAVFIFRDADSLKRFASGNWRFTGEAEATAKGTDKGGEVSTAGTPSSGVKVYQFTKAGLRLQASLPVARYWRYDNLN